MPAHPTVDAGIAGQQAGHRIQPGRFGVDVVGGSAQSQQQTRSPRPTRRVTDREQDRVVICAARPPPSRRHLASGMAPRKVMAGFLDARRNRVEALTARRFTSGPDPVLAAIARVSSWKGSRQIDNLELVGVHRVARPHVVGRQSAAAESCAGPSASSESCAAGYSPGRPQQHCRSCPALPASHGRRSG